MTKKFNNDLIFLIGIFLLPFENFFFAPSWGWATITPIIFAIYIVFNLKNLIKKIKQAKKITYILITIIVFNVIAYMLNGLNIKNVVNAIITIALGLVNIISIYIYYEKNKDLNKIIKLTLISYTITFIIGIIEFITIKLDINIMYNLFEIIFKRNYMNNNRIQFFFTEPSFIGMHVFGILLPLYLFSKNKSLLILIISYIVASILFKSGVRIIIDLAVVTTIFLTYYLISKKKFALLIVIPIIFILTITIGYNTNIRIKKIINNGIYADGSLASRYFRIEATIYGYIEDFPQVLIGYGIGNSLIPLRSGYYKALEEYKSNYMKEIIELGNPEFNDDSVSYCLYTRFISEFGILILGLAVYFIIKITKQSKFKYKWPYLLTVLYIYLQFESYGFYAIWMYILAMEYTRNEKYLIIQEGT